MNNNYGYTENQLFSLKTLEKEIERNDITLTKTQIKSTQIWIEHLNNKKLSKEKSNYLIFVEYILKDILGYTVGTIDFEKDNIEFSVGGVLGIEVKSTDTKNLFMPQNREKGEFKTPITQLWNYMGSNNFTFGICTNYQTFVLITKQFGMTKHFEFDFLKIYEKTDNDGIICINKNELKKFILLFSKKWLSTDYVNQLNDNSIREEKEFTQEFYNIYNETRSLITKKFKTTGNLEDYEALKNAQTFLNRIMFIFFVEDKFMHHVQIFKKIVKISSLSFEHNSQSIFEHIIKYFDYFNKGNESQQIFGFNGGLFKNPPLNSQIFFNDQQTQDSEKIILSKLERNINKQLKEELKDIQYAQLDTIIKKLLIIESFDFNTEISVNILGHIFEQSLNIFDNSNTRKKDGVYYTPEYITDYICRKTIIPYLSKSLKCESVGELISEYRDDIEKLEKKFFEIKILDVSCGSGAFLSKAADILMEIYEGILEYRSLEHNGNNSSKTISKTLPDFHRDIFLHEVIKKNIFGVDKSPEAVEIAKLSIFFKLASNIEPLPTIDTIRVGDSLMGFNWEQEFPSIMADGGFDIIIGNPPYIKHEKLVALKQYVNSGQTEIMPNIRNFDIVLKSDISIYFYYLALGVLLKPNGKLGFISSDSWLSVKYGEEFQKFLLSQCNIERLIKTDFNVFHDADVKTVTILLTKFMDLNNKETGEISFIHVSKDKKISQIEKLLNVNTVKQNEIKIGNLNTYFMDDIDSIISTLTPQISMIPLSQICKIQRGPTTGCNQFFILKRPIKNKYDIPNSYLIPLVSKNMSKHYDVAELNNIDNEIEEYMFVGVTTPIGELQLTKEGRKVLKYIQYGETLEIASDNETIRVPDLPSVSAHKPHWYSLNLKSTPPILLSQVINNKLKIYENTGGFHTKDTYAYVYPHKDKFIKPLLAFFASSWCKLYMEIHGLSMGGSALKFQIYHYAQLPVPDFTNLSKNQLEDLTQTWDLYKHDLDQSKLDKIINNILFTNDDEDDDNEKNNEKIRNALLQKVKKRMDSKNKDNEN